MTKNRSIFYNLRRFGQIMAYKLTSPETVSRLYFKIVLGYKLNLSNPQTFNEKLQWLKLYYWPKCQKAIKCADKFGVREYIKSIGEERLLNDLLFVWNDVNEIKWEELPDRFVIKCNHGCGYNIICPNKTEFNIISAKKKISKWMNEDFSLYNAEPHYSKIERKIICEKFLDGEVINYNIYCLNGVPTFFSVAGGLGNGISEHLTYYNIDGTEAPYKNRSYLTHNNILSDQLPEMIATAKRLSAGFPFVRVDLFDINGKIVLSELTFTPGGALIPFSPMTTDKELGKMLDISSLIAEKERLL